MTKKSIIWLSAAVVALFLVVMLAYFKFRPIQNKIVIVNDLSGNQTVHVMCYPLGTKCQKKLQNGQSSKYAHVTAIEVSVGKWQHQKYYHLKPPTSGVFRLKMQDIIASRLPSGFVSECTHFDGKGQVQQITCSGK